MLFYYIRAVTSIRRLSLRGVSPRRNISGGRSLNSALVAGGRQSNLSYKDWIASSACGGIAMTNGLFLYT